MFARSGHGFRLALGLLLPALVHCARAEQPAVPAPPSVPVAVAAPVLVADAAQGRQIEPSAVQVAEDAQPVRVTSDAGASALSSLGSRYAGVHKLGVNRVTNMARVGSATFARDGDTLRLQGRVARGAHWLELAGTVEPQGANKFVLSGTLRGVPDMAWAGEPLRERSTEGRFGFEVRQGRPYWRMYEVNGVSCVCDDGCGNDFCYVDIETAAAPEAGPRQIAH